MMKVVPRGFAMVSSRRRHAPAQNVALTPSPVKSRAAASSSFSIGVTCAEELPAVRNPGRAGRGKRRRRRLLVANAVLAVQGTAR